MRSFVEFDVHCSRKILAPSHFTFLLHLVDAHNFPSAGFSKVASGWMVSLSLVQLLQESKSGGKGESADETITTVA
jgi:hypothetical protein